MEPLLLTVRQAEAMTNLSHGTLYRLIATGELATVTIGRARRVPRAELEAFVARRTAEAAGVQGER